MKPYLLPTLWVVWGGILIVLNNMTPFVRLMQDKCLLA